MAWCSLAVGHAPQQALHAGGVDKTIDSVREGKPCVGSEVTMEGWRGCGLFGLA